jgi:hypothetical protein
MLDPTPLEARAMHLAQHNIDMLLPMFIAYIKCVEAVSDELAALCLHALEVGVATFEPGDTAHH